MNSIRRRYHTRGHISIEQIQTTYERLQQGPADKIKLVVFHQPFYTPPDDAHGIKDCPVLGKMALENGVQRDYLECYTGIYIKLLYMI